jgi:hypothetical protein
VREEAQGKTHRSPRRPGAEAPTGLKKAPSERCRITGIVRRVR